MFLPPGSIEGRVSVHGLAQMLPKNHLEFPRIPTSDDPSKGPGLKDNNKNSRESDPRALHVIGNQLHSTNSWERIRAIMQNAGGKGHRP